MEDLKLQSEDGKLYRIDLDERDILVISISPKDFEHPDKVRAFSQYLSDMLKKHGFENPVMVLPNDMDLFTIRINSLSKMKQIEDDPFDDVDFKLD